MATRKPLVLNSGQIEQLQSGDTLDAAITEVDLVTMTNGEASAISNGEAVYTDAADDVKLALADAAGTARVLGLVKTDSIAASASGSIQIDGIISIADWTAATGSATLTSGSVYYLDNSTAGNLTSTAPTTGYVVEVGQAISTTEMAITIKAPVKL